MSGFCFNHLNTRDSISKILQYRFQWVFLIVFETPRNVGNHPAKYIQIWYHFIPSTFPVKKYEISGVRIFTPGRTRPRTELLPSSAPDPVVPPTWWRPIPGKRRKRRRFTTWWSWNIPKGVGHVGPKLGYPKLVGIFQWMGNGSIPASVVLFPFWWFEWFNHVERHQKWWDPRVVYDCIVLYRYIISYNICRSMEFLDPWRPLVQDPTGWLEEWNSELGKEAEGCYLDLRWAGSSDFQRGTFFCLESVWKFMPFGDWRDWQYGSEWMANLGIYR